MTQLNLHKNYLPNSQNLSIIEKIKSTYKLWHDFLLIFPKTCRYTLGLKIDSLFIEIIELAIKASYLTKTEKIIHLMQLSMKLDLLKFFLQITWEIKILDDKKYIRLSERLDEIGRMLGGWIKALR